MNIAHIYSYGYEFTFTSAAARRIRFGVPLGQALRTDALPEPLKVRALPPFGRVVSCANPIESRAQSGGCGGAQELLVYIAREGVSVVNLFRRPGNPKEINAVIEALQRGRPFAVSDYSFYALANVVKVRPVPLSFRSVPFPPPPRVAPVDANALAPPLRITHYCPPLLSSPLLSLFLTREHVASFHSSRAAARAPHWRAYA